MDKYGPKLVIIVGSIITSVGFFCLTHAKNPMGLFLSYGVLCGIGTGCTGLVVSSAAVGKWFDRRMGMAMGVGTMGIGVGTMTMSPIAGYIVANYDWQFGFYFFGSIILIFGIIISLLLMGKTKPESFGLQPDGEPAATDVLRPILRVNTLQKSTLRSVLRSSRFWLIAFCFGLAVMTVMMTFIHQVAYAIEQNISRIEAAAALGIIGLSSSLGKFFFGWLCDRIRDAKLSAALGFLIMAAGMFILLKATSVTVLYLFSLVYGFGYGSVAPVMPYLISEHFGRHRLGSAYGALTFFVAGIGGSIGPTLGGFIYDWRGSYSDAWTFNLVILIFATLLIFALKPTKQFALSRTI